MTTNAATAFDSRTHATGAAAVTVISCRPLADAGFPNAFSTRMGGVSALPSDALNLHFKDDAPDHVRENRQRFLAAVGLDWPIVTARQVHSTMVRVHRDRDDQTGGDPEGDVVVTDAPETFVGVKTADCLSILIADPISRAVAAVHAGWKGTALGVAAEAVRALERLFGTHAKDCLAAFGPSACKDCYEVGEDVAEEFRRADLGAPPLLRPAKESGKYRLDVAGANREQLLRAGFTPSRIFATTHCPMHQNELFFSHRRESSGGAPVGRMLSIVGALKNAPPLK